MNLIERSMHATIVILMLAMAFWLVSTARATWIEASTLLELRADSGTE